MPNLLSPAMWLSQTARRTRGLDNSFLLVDVHLFRAECPLDPFDSEPELSDHSACQPQASERWELILLHGSHDMTDTGGTSQDIDKDEDKEGCRENPEENTSTFVFQEERSYQGAGCDQRQDETPGGPASCSSGDDCLDIGEVEAFIILGEAIAIYGKDMVIPQVERASGKRDRNETSPAGTSPREALVSGFCPAIHLCIHRRETK
jgi:hypothetical protein